jgi:uncharacterized protein
MNRKGYFLVFMSVKGKNVLGAELQDCSRDPMTGFFRDGCCRTREDDTGRHVVCVRVTAEFLEFSRRVGNDLSTPMPEYNFPGLNPGDQWCLCALRWQEALESGAAPLIDLHATHEAALNYIDLEDMKLNSISFNPRV